MRALVCADLHINIDNRFEDTKSILRQMYTYAVSNRLDQVWILGDIYNRKRPYNSEKVLFHRFVKSIYDRGIKILIVAGNHDIDKYKVSAVEEFNVLDLPNVEIVENPTVLNIDNSKIYLGHFLVNGASLGASNYIASNAVNIKDVLKSEADLYLLGDVHKAQKLHTNPDVIYVGSPERISFSERDETKGFILVETCPVDFVRYTFIELQTRPMVQLNIPSGQKELFLPDSPYPSTDKAIVKIKITCTKEEYKEINEEDIRKQVLNAHSVKIEYDIIKGTRVRNANISEGVSPDTAFINYAKEVELDAELVNLGLEIIKES